MSKMEQRGGFCITRYDGGGEYGISKVERIMMKFRPIAPRPASTNASLSSPENGGPSVKVTARGRRRNGVKDSAAANKRSRIRTKRRSLSEDSSSVGEPVVKTLPLLPEAPEVRKSPERQISPLSLIFGSGDNVPTRRRLVVGSLVKVERVIDTEGFCGIGRTDEERIMFLDLDTCPGFISDGLNRVRWTNAAYRRMVAGIRGEAEEEVVACLGWEEGVVVPWSVGVFTCRVRVFTCGRCQTVPCDVWRMDCGGWFAWRLDTTAALSLGR